MSDTVSEKTETEETTTEEQDMSIRLEDVTKVFEEGDGSEIVAVDEVSLDIYDGEFIVLVGPSGCGKTTTLRCIAGLEEQSEGSITIEDEEVSGQDPRERDIAMVFQNYALYPHKTVRENLAFPLQIRKYPDKEIEQQVREVAELLGIPELLDRHPSDLSGGQQQRVSLGRAIIRDPRVFLFDEPLSNLDAKLRIQMRTELNKLHDRVGKTSIYVTHDQEEAMTLGDRVAVMNDGRVQQIDKPSTVYAEPVNRFVAGFVGEPPMNFFDVSLEERNDEYWVVSEMFELALPDMMGDRIRSWDGDMSNLEFGIRPEDLTDAGLHTDEISEDRAFEAYVKVIEPMGPHMDLTLAPPRRTEDEDAEFTARVSNDSDVSRGETITLLVDRSETHLFDNQTGDNIVR
jgi:multiple sugar transport system ATP-binding protein